MRAAFGVEHQLPRHRGQARGRRQDANDDLSALIRRCAPAAVEERGDLGPTEHEIAQGRSDVQAREPPCVMNRVLEVLRHVTRTRRPTAGCHGARHAVDRPVMREHGDPQLVAPDQAARLMSNVSNIAQP